MAIPTSYAEIDLRDYMLSVTKAVSAAAGICENNFEEAVNDALLAYGVTDIAEAIDISKLRALAKIEAWKCVIAHLMTAYDFSADGGSYKRSQMLAGAEKALERAENAAAQAGYVDAYAIQMGTLTRPYDPYASECARDELERI